MTNGTASGRPRRQRASRLSRDLLMELSAAWMAVKIARTLARKLETAAPGRTSARLAEEISIHIGVAKKALSRAAVADRRAPGR